jgi:hypothetical protein
MHFSTLPYEVFESEGLVQNAPYEGNLSTFSISIQEEFFALITQFSSTLRHLPSGELREQFNQCLRRIEYLRLRVECDAQPLPF